MGNIKEHDTMASGSIGNLPPYTNDNESEKVGVVESADQLHRKLNGRQIQMMAIGGSIGTALFVSIGSGLIHGGPGAWIRMGSKWVDEAFGFMLGWNFFFYEAVLIPWEISALNLVLTFWRDDIPVWAVCLGCIFLYGIINLFAVKWYGESEFWLSSGKVILIGIVFCFTFITMVGGNPQHDAYGFRYWKTPGAFAEYIHTGELGKFEGFLASLWKAAFTIVGPEYISLMAGEASNPRKTMKTAFKTVYARFGIFFIGGALCCGIVIPYNDPKLVAILTGSSSGSGTGAASPYVIAMQNLGIGVLPHITNALLVTSIFSAGNSYVYCASRTLYSLSLDGHAPAILRKCTKKGVPIYCFLVVMIFPFLSFLQLSAGSAQVINWLANLTEASQIIDYIGMTTIYIFFYRALAAQGIARSTLPYRGWWQPWCAYFGLGSMLFTVTMYGYTTFYPASWDLGTFFSYYTMVFVSPVLYLGWKFVKKSKVVKPLEADLVWERPIIDAYEESLVEKDADEGFWREVAVMMRVRKRKVGGAVE